MTYFKFEAVSDLEYCNMLVRTVSYFKGLVLVECDR